MARRKKQTSIDNSPTALPIPAEELNGKKVKQPKAEKPVKSEKKADKSAEKPVKELTPLANLTGKDQIGVRFFPADGTTPVTKIYKAVALEHAQKFAMKHLGEGWSSLKSAEGKIELSGIDKKEFSAEIQRKQKTDVGEAIIAKGRVHAQMNKIEDMSELVDFAEKVNVQDPDRFLELPNAGLIKMNLVNSIAGHVAQGLRKGHFSIEELQSLGFDC